MKKAVILMLVLFTVSVFAQTKSKNAKVGAEFTLAAGQKAFLKTDKLNVEFVSVLEDSRCPENVDCVWAGNAKVQIKVFKGKMAAQTFELNTGLEPQIIEAAGYKIRLVKLNPTPNPNASRAEYAATLIVQK